MRTTPAAPHAPVKVSIVVPVHNTGEPVLTGLRSFLAQTMPRSDYEVIYVDDGSTDDTVAILESEIKSRDAEQTVQVLRIENSGWPGKPRNVGTDAARGEFVHYVDDDDWLAPEALERTYARAKETGADIVIGRMAGHGRKAPRVLFEEPVTAADLRKDTALLASMTVHKLFRRAFLQKHRLRFVEGRVRLEDHLFTLRAFLLTGRVATVHDYTCYHWVLHKGDDRQNISYTTIEPGSYLDSIRRVLAVLDAPDTYVAPGPHRDKLTVKWYGKKALDRLTGQKFLTLTDDRRAEWFDAVSALAAHMPPETDAALPTRLRIVAALARHGDRALLEEYARFDADVDHQPRVEAAEWQDGTLAVQCSTRLVRKARESAQAVPVAFARAEERYLLRLPHRTATVPGLAETADFTNAIPRSHVRAQLRRREDRTELTLPVSHRVIDLAVPEDAVGQQAARSARRLRLPAWLNSRLPGTSRPPADCSLRYEVEFSLDPATADHGKPLAPGTWDVRLQLGCGGWRTARKLRDLTIDVPAEGRPRQLPRQRATSRPTSKN